MKDLREYKLINQKFSHPLISSSMIWEQRNSIVLREKLSEKCFGYGEIAPTPSFPNQPLIEVVLKEAEKWKNGEPIDFNSPLRPALSCIKSELWTDFGETSSLSNSSGSLSNFKRGTLASNSVKIKIGILPVLDEIKKVKQRIRILPEECMVRLDANGSFTLGDLNRWIEAFETEPRIQYIEQPLQDHFREKLFEISKVSPVPLAIDETVIALGSPQLAKDNGWLGFYILKPTLLNDWSDTINFAKNNSQAVFSTVFETPFGYEALIRAAISSTLDAGISRKHFAHLSTELSCHHQKKINVPAADQIQLHELWNRI